MEDYKKKYEEALERTRTFILRWQGIGAVNSELALKELKGIFSELKDNKDEVIKNDIIITLSNGLMCDDSTLYPGANTTLKEAVVWLKKQGEHANFRNKIQIGDKVTRNEDGVLVNLSQLDRVAEPAEKQRKKKPKFKVGDWVVQDNVGVYRIIEICKSWYEVVDFENNHYSISFDNENMCHLWTIRDANPGDVLAATDGDVFIFKHMDKTGLSLCRSYCEISGNSRLGLGFDFSINTVYPATKEQHDLLFSKIKEAGYEWNDEKKELRNIEEKPIWNEKDEKMLDRLIKI